MPKTYSLISSSTLNSDASDFTFSDIPNTYTDLIVRATLRSTRNAADDLLYIRLNYDNTSLYSYVRIDANGSSVSSTLGTGSPLTFGYQFTGNSALSNTYSNFEMYIPFYTANRNKAIHGFVANESGTTAANMTNGAFLYRSASTINAITIYPGFGSIKSDSSFYLYGIKIT